MAVPPKFAGQILASKSTTEAKHTLELYLDYVCPFSAKIFKTFYGSVAPKLETKYAQPGVRVVFRQQIQPWHPSSTLVHEAGAAVLKLAPNKFWQFSQALFDRQTEFFDVNVVNESRNVTYKRLAALTSQAVPEIQEGDVFKLLEVNDVPVESADGKSPPSLNAGNKVTDDIKVMVKMNRLTGVHVTPTVVFNGVVENSISSGWSEEQWDEWLEKNLK